MAVCEVYMCLNVLTCNCFVLLFLSVGYFKKWTKYSILFFRFYFSSFRFNWTLRVHNIQLQMYVS